MKILNFWMVAFMALSLSTTLTSCSDDDEKKEETEMKTLTVDATAYNQWVYVNLKDGKTQTVTMEGSDDESAVTIDWQIAIHRYTEVKTNGGSVVKTDMTDMSKVTTIPTGGYVADESEQNILVRFAMPPTDDCYVKSHCNTAMVWTEGSAMAGTLATTNNVFVLKCKDGTYAKLQFTDFANADNVIDKGRVMQQAFRGMTLLDYAINASLVLSYVAMRKEDKAGLVTFNEHFDTFVHASRQPGQMKTLLENLYSQQTTFGETDFSSLCVHLNKHVNKRSLLVLYTNFSGISSLNRQLAYLQQLNRQNRLLVIFFEDTDLEEYIATPAKDTEGYYRHVIAEKFVFENRLTVSTLKRHGICSLLTTPENLSVDVINKYLEMKSRNQI